jgi:PAS domain S-box-containing protein
MVAGSRFGDYQAAYRFGQLGHDVVERHGLKRFQARTYMCFGGFVLPWTKHIRAGRDLLHRGLQAANKTGDLVYAACGHHLTTNLLATGEPLVDVQRDAENGLAVAQKAQFRFLIDIAATQLELIRTLRGLTPTFGSFDDGQLEELRIERRFTRSPDLQAECTYLILKLQARFFSGEYRTAVEASSRAQSLLWTLNSHFETAEYQFYSALSQAAFCDSAPAAERQQHMEALAAHHKQLQVWAANCPDNFENRAALVGAEIARLEGRELDAERLYEQAIRSARANAFIHNEALANEVASRFYATRGFEKIARVYLQDARDGYLRWGADGKVRQLERLHPHLRDAPVPASPTTTIGTPVERLDVGTVLKAAVSGEIELGKLIETLLRIAVEHAGAERGLLILFPGDEPRIAAEATTGRGQVEVTLRQTAASPAELPESVLNTVIRTRKSVILDDALAQNPFSADEYICQKRARSVLCLPLVKQAKLIGVLYLENNLASRVFTPARISVLDLLASQAAISLENARLYNDLQEREAKIRRLVDSNIIGIMTWDYQGRIIEANQAFLDIVGYAREDLVSGRLRWRELTPAEWHDADDQARAELKAAGTVQPREKEYFRKDGSRVAVLLGATTFGEQDEGVAFVLDLTERKRAEHERQLLASLVEQAADLMAIADLEGGTPIYLNKAGLKMVGFDSLEEARTRRGIHYIFPADRQFVNEVLWPTVLEKGSWSGEMRFRHFKTGDPIPVLYSAFRIDDPETGQPVNVGNVCSDISERKRAEAEARENDRRYREMQMELAHANRVATMGQLTASIAHEVNQPIAATVTNAEAGLRWLRAGSSHLEEVQQVLTRIVEDGNRAGEVIHRIRALMKKAPPRKDRLEINGVILEIIELTRGEAVKYGISVLTELAHHLPVVEADRVQLQQVLLNLIVNALEAMGAANEGPRELLISTGKAESSGVLVAVQDSGPGLEAAMLERVFESFYTTKPTGLGLGLSICRSIIEAYGGRLWASTNQRRGATFQFTLPGDANIPS